MKKYWGFYSNETYSVGCNGRTVYIFDADGNELKRFQDFPYAYCAAFMPGKNIIAIKSTEGHIGFYDLDKLSLIKKHTITKYGCQDQGFTFSANGQYFYNIESPHINTRTQLGIYETTSFTKIHTLFSEEKNMFLENLEIDKKTGICYVLGYMRDKDTGIMDHGFVGIFDQEKLSIVNIVCIPYNEHEYLEAYKSWETKGFTEKALEWNYILKDLKEIRKITIKEIYDKYVNQ